ncbi:MAG: sigma-70 family RNA polymerase sigma factor [Acidimicrobiia bacterium]
MSNHDAIEQGAEPVRLFDSLFECYHDAVLRYCVRRLGPSEAEDAAADVFAVVWQRLDLVPAGDGTRAWIIGVAYKVVGNRFRSRRRRAQLSRRIKCEQGTRREDSPPPDPQTQTLHLALGRLSQTDQELIRLASWDDLSRSEIGEVLGIRVNAVDQRLHRARTRLKTHFDHLAAASQASRPEEASI